LLKRDELGTFAVRDFLSVSSRAGAVPNCRCGEGVRGSLFQKVCSKIIILSKIRRYHQYNLPTLPPKTRESARLIQQHGLSFLSAYLFERLVKST
jgi:hypothetical protein